MDNINYKTQCSYSITAYKTALFEADLSNTVWHKNERDKWKSENDCLSACAAMGAFGRAPLGSAKLAIKYNRLLFAILPWPTRNFYLILFKLSLPFPVEIDFLPIITQLKLMMNALLV